jgi:hypothetical protein
MKPKPVLAIYLLPRLQDVLFLSLFLGVLVLGPRLLNIDGDLGRHLTIGKYIIQERHIPISDLFSHTLSGQPLTPHEWLAEVWFAFFNRFGGLDGVVLLCAVLIACTFTLIFQQAQRRSQSLTLAVSLAALAAGTSSLHWLARPHLFTLLLVAVWNGLLDRMRRGSERRWWLFPLLMLLWVNLHGAFLAGFVIWGAYLVGEVVEARDWGLRSDKSKLLLGAGCASLAATALNPAGLGIWQTSLGYLQNRYLVGHTAEYLPPNFHDSSTWPFLVMLVLQIIILSQGWNLRAHRETAKTPLIGVRASLTLTDVILLAGWTAMGLYSVRNVPLYALVAGPLLAEVVGGIIQGYPELSGWRKFDSRLQLVEQGLSGKFWPVVILLLVSAGWLMGGGRPGSLNRFDPHVFPVTATDWLEAHQPSGRMFNHFPWGGYLLYRLWPDQRVFIDGQTDFYGEALTRQYEQVILLHSGWQDVFDLYQVEWAILPVQSLLSQALATQPGWQELYRDETAVIWSFNR